MFDGNYNFIFPVPWHFKKLHMFNLCIVCIQLPRFYGGARGVMVMDTATRVQILDETDCISHSTNTFGKGMNPIILPPIMSK